MVQQDNKKIQLHACCGICSAYPMQKLKELGYTPVVFFSNSNLDTKEEFERRLEAQQKVCEYHKVELLVDEYNHDEFLKKVSGLENEPECGKRCAECIKYRLQRTVERMKDFDTKTFGTSLGISPYKDYEMVTKIGHLLATDSNTVFFGYNFRKQDGVLKTNILARELNLYRQNYCGCEFSKNKKLHVL